MNDPKTNGRTTNPVTPSTKINTDTEDLGYGETLHDWGEKEGENGLWYSSGVWE